MQQPVEFDARYFVSTYAGPGDLCPHLDLARPITPLVTGGLTAVCIRCQRVVPVDWRGFVLEGHA